MKERMKDQQQNKHIFALKGQLGIEQEELRDVVEQVTGQRSISTLTYVQAAKVIHKLELMMPQSDETDMSGEQRSKIWALFYANNWTMPGLNRFMTRQIGYHKLVQDLTKPEATKLITGMEKLAKEGRKPE